MDITVDNYRTKLQEIKRTNDTELNKVIMKYVAEDIYRSKRYTIEALIELLSSNKKDLEPFEATIIDSFNIVKGRKKQYERQIISKLSELQNNIKESDYFINLMNEIIKECNDNNTRNYRTMRTSGMALNFEIPPESINRLIDLKIFMEDKIASIKKKGNFNDADLEDIKKYLLTYLNYYIVESITLKQNPKKNIFPYDMCDKEVYLILLICDIIYKYKIEDLDSFIFNKFIEPFYVDKYDYISGGKKSKKLPKKEILGKMRCIYKIPGDRKEYVKHKGKLITVKDYKKLMKAKKPTKPSKPTKKK